MSFSHKIHVSFYETDMAGVVHHSNYLRYFEDTRTQWMREKSLMPFHSPQANLTLAVLESSCRHYLPAFYEDELYIALQIQLRKRLKILIQYAITSNRYGDQTITTGMTLHVPLNNQLKICRLPDKFQQVLESEKWTETWPLN